MRSKNGARREGRMADTADEREGKKLGLRYDWESWFEIIPIIVGWSDGDK